MRHEHDPGTLDLMTGGLWLGYARVSTDDQELNSYMDTSPVLASERCPYSYLANQRAECGRT